MSDKEARIRLGVDNPSQTISDLGRIAASFGGILGAARALKGAADDAAGAIIRIRPLNLTQATNDAQKYREEITRLSYAAGTGAKGVDALAVQMERIAERTKIGAHEVVAAAREYGRLTGDMKGAIETIGDLGVVANASGRDLQELTRIGASLHNNLGVPMKDVAGAVEEYGKMGQNVGMRGGRMGLPDALERLGPRLSKFDTSTPGARERLAAFVAATIGSSPTDQGVGDVEALLGWFSGEALGMGRYLGHSVVHNGKVDDPMSILAGIKRKAGRSRAPAALTRVLQNYSSLTAGQKALLLKAMDLEDAVLGKQERATAEQYGLRGVGAIDLGEAEAPPAIPGAMILSQPAPRIRIPTEEELDRARPSSLATDPYGASAAGRLRGAEVERENKEREIGREFLKGRDRYETQNSAAEKITTETAIDAAGNLPVVGGYLKTAVHAGAASGYDPRIPDRTAAPSRLEQGIREQIEQQKETNRILRERAADRNSRDVERRKGRPQ